MLELTRATLEGLPRSGATDPIEYYRRPLVGRLFRERINIGLRLLGDRRFAKGLEVGYGAGAVLLALAPAVGELFGIDLDADPEAALRALRAKGAQATLTRGSVYELPYPDATFDLVVSFSVFEHLHEYPKALREVRRVLTQGGAFLLGMPSVNRTMELGFRAIGFRGIEDHHVTRPADVAQAFEACGLSVQRRATLDLPVKPFTLYHTWLLAPSPG